MHSDALLNVVIALAGVLVSAVVAAFIAGSRWGAVSGKVDQLAANQVNAATKHDLQGMSERLARIEGMFELKLRDTA